MLVIEIKNISASVTQEPLTSKEQFQAIVEQLAASLEERTGVNWHVRSLPEKFTIKDRVKEVEQEPRAWQPRGNSKAS